MFFLNRTKRVEYKIYVYHRVCYRSLAEMYCIYCAPRIEFMLLFLVAIIVISEETKSTYFSFSRLHQIINILNHGLLSFCFRIFIRRWHSISSEHFSKNDVKRLRLSVYSRFFCLNDKNIIIEFKICDTLLYN